MCGIAGIISPDPSLISVSRLKRMTDAIAHRGPEGEAFWTDNTGMTGMGHRRLSIIDRSPAAAQPMRYLDRYTITHNGEIYNYLEIRSALQKKGYIFQSSSDTEVILAAYDQYKEKCLEWFDGMFAFAIWDDHTRTIFCARDRFGEKPFYYFHDESAGALYFGSEMKALRAAGLIPSPDMRAMLNYLSVGNVSDPSDPGGTFYEGFRKLPAAHYLKFSPDDTTVTLSRYWEPDTKTNSGISDDAAIGVFRDLFSGSVGRRLRSEAALGASLSGGLDSAAVTAVAKGLLSGQPLKTFTAVFPGFEKDESAYSSSAAQYLGVENYTVAPTAEGFIHDFHELAYHQEEPFSSASVYAQYCVFRLAREQNVTVLLDGQGADEILAGYSKHIHWFLQELLRKGRFSAARKERQALLNSNMSFKWGYANPLAAMFPQYVARKLAKRALNKIDAHPFLSRDFIRAYYPLQTPYKPVVSNLNDILYADTFRHGLEDLLRYADRNSMAHGRETRLPFLSHELVSFIFSLPARFKIRDGNTKWMLRKAVSAQLPSEIAWRKDKIAFEPPQEKWMQQPAAQAYYHEALNKLVQEKVLQPTVLNRKYAGHGAYAPDGSDWRYLMSGMFMKMAEENR